MNKKQIIKRLKEENNNDVSFSNNFTEIRTKLNFTSPSIYPKQTFPFFKQLTAALSMIVLVFTVLITYNLTRPNDNLNANTPDDEGSTQSIFDQFEDLDAVYLKKPVKTYIVDNNLVEMYLGVLEDEKVVFIFSTTNEDSGKIFVTQDLSNSLFPNNDSSLEPENLRSEDYLSPIIVEKNNKYYIYFDSIDEEYDVIDLSDIIDFLENN